MLSPAYDIVAYACYLNGQGAALRWQPGKAARSTPRSPLDKATLWSLTQAAQDIVQRAGLRSAITPQRLQRIAVQTRQQAMDVWPGQLKELPLTRAQQMKLKKRWQDIA
ncbi:MAG: hypothetical protein HC765_12700 [Brachymonas sp.]|nr:hypothetical protein [Brachymonas sp.]